MRIPGNVTHTYATLEVGASTHADVRDRLLAVDYGHAINVEGEIDMHGIALVAESPPWRKGNCPRCGALIYLDHAHICNTERSNWDILHEEIPA